MSDSYTEVTEQSWFGRIGKSIKGILVGLVLIVLAPTALFWNEGRAVQTARSLEEGAAAVVSVPNDAVDDANEGRLVHITGMASTDEVLTDPEFGVSLVAIHLRRDVEMYQWEETKKSETRKKVGGGSRNETTYSYHEEWSPRLIDSSAFHKPDGHANPATMPYAAFSTRAGNVSLGAFRLSARQIGKIDDAERLDADPADLPNQTAERLTAHAGGYYLGDDRARPQIGDMRITFSAVRPQEISLIARQIGNTFEPYDTKAGDALSMVVLGTQRAESMFEQAHARNAALTWIIRLAGSIAMFVGFMMVFAPLVVLGDVIPLVGTLVGTGTAVVSLVLAASISFITIAVAWVTYRPVIGLPLLLLAGGLLFLLVRRAGKTRRAKTAEPTGAVAA